MKVQDDFFKNLDTDIMYHFFRYLGLIGLSKLRLNRHLNDIITPILINEMKKRPMIADVAIGAEHIVVLNHLGQVFTSGLDIYYSLGQGKMGSETLLEAENRKVNTLCRAPIQVGDAILAPVISVHAGAAATVLGNADHQLFACGWNNHGRLGLGIKEDCVIDFTRCVGLTPPSAIVDIQIGHHFSIVLNNHGKGWGSGRTRAASSLAFKAEEYGDAYSFQPLIIYDKVQLCALSVGNTHYFTIDQEDHPLMMGNNSKGQLGIDSNDDHPHNSFDQGSQYKIQFDNPNHDPFFHMFNNRVRLVAAGHDFSYIVTTANKVFSCGVNAKGQLALGHNNDRKMFCEVMLPEQSDAQIVQIACGKDHVVLLAEDNSLLAAGSNKRKAYSAEIEGETNRLVEVETIEEPIKKIYAAKQRTICLSQNGTLWGRGANQVGQLASGQLKTLGIFRKIQIPDNGAEFEGLMEKRNQLRPEGNSANKK